MLAPKALGPFEPWRALEPTLAPLLRDEIAACFLPWSDASAAEFDVELAGRPFRQQTQKYHARSLAALRERYAAAADGGPLDATLERTGCRRWLAGA